MWSSQYAGAGASVKIKNGSNDRKLFQFKTLEPGYTGSWIWADEIGRLRAVLGARVLRAQCKVALALSLRAAFI